MDEMLQKIGQSLDAPCFSVEKQNSDRALEKKVVTTCLTNKMSLREIAASLNMTYYRVQKIASASWMTVVTHHRTLWARGYEFQVRMLPMAITTHEMNKNEASQRIRNGEDMTHAVELRVSNALWLDFDAVEIKGSRQHQLEFFYQKLSLADFAKSVAINLDLALTKETLLMLTVFFAEVRRTYQAGMQLHRWSSLVSRIRKHPLGADLLAGVLNPG